MAAGTTFAQEQGSMKLGAGLAFGTEAALDEEGSKGGLGIYVGGEYFFTEKISAAPSFTYFFKSKTDFFGGEMSANNSALDIDGRYYFASTKQVSFYGLAGLSVGFSKVKVEGVDGWRDSESASNNKAGVNVGAGMVYPLTETLDLNAQIKYNTPLEQLDIQVGIAFPIN
ncbi:hypothetical protein A3841_06900 [Pontibacter flavimaris]|uniref:Outer membrane protein beta-barrel domain-containing protein n=2 Tax=Pontibacter flavimaris TaxID=1797110 RepID=A0A1Q5P8C6_9BACT|nr:hypothetical protein A3841_06900 [Pontibacter flavimaris]